MALFRASIQGSVDLYLSNVLISFGAIALIGLNTFQFGNILSIGRLNSITIYLLICFEIVRWVFNTFCLKLTAINRASLRASAKKPTIFGQIKSVCKFGIFLLGVVLAYGAICILMGAPLQTHHEETIVLATILATLTVFPLVIYLGTSGTLQNLFYDSVDLNTRNEVALLEYLQQNAVAVVTGAWAGSVVTPLDWDRPWQEYPIPNIIGALAGLTLANTYTLLLTGLAAFDVTKKNVAKGKKNL